MEIFFLFCVILLSVIAFSIVIISFFYLKSNARLSLSNLPPGKMGFPIIGESVEFFSAAKRGYPQKFIHDRVAKYSSKVFKTSLLGKPMVVITGASGHKFLFSNENKLVRPWYPDSMVKIFASTKEIISAAEETKKVRGLLPNFLKIEALHRYIGVMDSAAKRHFEEYWEGKKELHVLPLAKRYTFSVVCKLFLSVEEAEQVTKLAQNLETLSTAMLSIPINFPGTSLNRGIKAAKVIKKELLAIIRQRKNDLLEKGGFDEFGDILSHMLLTADEDGQYMSETEIAYKILGLLIAASDTTTSAITSIVKYLAELPHIYNQVLKEQMGAWKSKRPGEFLNWEDIRKMKYSWNVVYEIIRIYPPAQAAFMEALNDISFNGFTIPKGWKIFWSGYLTHMDSEYFLKPENFDPSRYEGDGPAPFTFVPFGGGPRMCPGREYARALILVFMHNIIKRFKWEKLIPDEKIVVVNIPIPEKGLPVRLLPRDS